MTPLDNLAHEPLQHDAVRRLVCLALEEDIGKRGDVTGRILPENAIAHGKVVSRVPGVLAGVFVAKGVLREVEPRAAWKGALEDGAPLEPRSVIATIEGPARGVLAAERTLLNFLQRLSGIATATKRYVDAIAGTRARIYDTRKTAPGWRALSKYAVRMGGGVNHRMGLYDQILIKDHHLVIFGGEPTGIAPAIAAAHREAPAGTPVEVEVTTIEGALIAAKSGADIILLDNMTVEAMTRAVSEVRALGGKVELEASGGITLETIRRVAETGVDRISVGWITHSSPALDLALDLEIRT